MHRTNEELIDEIKETYAQLKLAITDDARKFLKTKLQNRIDRLTWQIAVGRTFV